MSAQFQDFSINSLIITSKLNKYIIIIIIGLQS